MTSAAQSTQAIVWRQLHWPRPLDPADALAVLRQWAADQRSHRLVLEARADEHGVAYLVGGPLVAVLNAQYVLKTVLPDIRITEISADRAPLLTGRKLRLSSRHRPLRTDEPERLARGVLGALTQVRAGETLTVQVILGPRRIPMAVPNNSPSSVVMPWWQVAWLGNGGQVDGEKRAALRNKVADHGFAATVRIGVNAPSPDRRRSLLVGLFNALRLSEAPGVQLGLRRESVKHVNEAQAPRLWPLRLGAAEVLNLTAWPIGDQPLPGQPALHPKRLSPVDGTTGSKRVVARATAPGVDTTLALPAAAALHHLHVLGPTGTGKSTLLLNLILQDIQGGRAVVVVDPQGDLVTDVVERMPPHRREDVIVLDPTDRAAPVGLNPLLTRGRNPEVVADSLLSVFKGLYGDNLGPRSTDILHSCLLTLTRRDDASLVMLPLLLTNPGFRRSVTAGVDDPIALGPFWDWYQHLSEGERHAAVAPIQNKLRQWLLRPSLRNVLGQRHPAWSFAEAFAAKRIVLVSLAQGQLGPEGAALLGALVVAELWQATVERGWLPKATRQPVMVYLDEFSTFLHLPTDLADALARSRGLGVAYTLAHQFLAQLNPAMRAAVLANARSRVCFQLAPEDATVIARSHPELDAEDFTSLGRYEIYASLFTRGQVSPYASGVTLAPPARTGRAAELRATSRHRYGRALDVIEREFAELLAPTTRADEPVPGRSRRRPS